MAHPARLGANPLDRLLVATDEAAPPAHLEQPPKFRHLDGRFVCPFLSSELNEQIDQICTCKPALLIRINEPPEEKLPH